MRSFWFDPYLWVHLAGVAVLPIALELCLLGLAVGDPFLPGVLEVLLVAIVGIAPILWMQWQKPFYIFSLLGVALKFEQLTIIQRRLLRRFKAPAIRVASVAVAAGLAIVLRQLYQLAPIAVEAADFLPQYRGVGLLLAAIGFFLSNLFLQIPVSVLLVMLTSEATLGAIEPYPLEEISQAFTVVGLQIKQILPQVAQPKPAQSEPAQSESVAASPPIESTLESVAESADLAIVAESAADAVNHQLLAEETAIGAVASSQRVTAAEPIAVGSEEATVTQSVSTAAEADVTDGEIAPD